MIFDGIYVLLTVLAFFRGWQKGLLWALASVIAVWVGVLTALKLSNFLSDYLISNQIINSQYTLPISFFLIFVAIILCFRLLSKLLEKVLDKVFLGAVNLFLGGILYSCVVAVVFSLVIWLCNKTTIFSKKVKTESKAYTYLQPIAPKVIALSSEYLPLCKQLYEQVNTTIDKVVDNINEKAN